MSDPRTERTRLSDDVYENLQSMLVDGIIQPGQRIRIDTLSRQLGVSQTPVREALSRLEAHGVVTKTHMIGYSAASKLTLEEFEDLFEARFLLEPFCANLAAARHRRSEIEHISEIASDMREEYEAGRMSYGAFAKSDGELHAAIVAATGNSYFVNTYAGFHCHLQLFRLMRNSHVTDDALDEHDLLVTAIRQRDPQAAATAMSEHLTASRNRLRGAFAAPVDGHRPAGNDERTRRAGERNRTAGSGERTRPATENAESTQRPARPRQRARRKKSAGRGRTGPGDDKPAPPRSRGNRIPPHHRHHQLSWLRIRVGSHTTS
jgi:DNA-binding GntR family transcriptional regulator